MSNELITRPLCIYHGSCDDGFAAAYVVRQALGEDGVEFYPGVYQQEPPDITGRDVLFVDFSYKRPVLQAMATSARSVLILDHHKTAQEDLGDFLPVHSWEEHLREGYSPCNMHAVFDMERSGAGLAWDFFIDKPRPEFIDYIEDRDLWRKKLPWGDEFTIALRSYPQTFAAWDKLMALPNVVAGLIEEGKTLQRYYRLRIEELKANAYIGRIESPKIAPGAAFICAITNAPYFAASEVAGELCSRPGAQFGASFFQLPNGKWQYSLRSRGDFDVSEVARLFGGGGHKAAAGFTADKLVHLH